MASIPSLSFQDTDVPRNDDDNMELASSPYRQNDELDFEIEEIHEPPVVPGNDMMEDAMEAEQFQQMMQDNFTEDSRDETMSDGEQHAEDIDFTTDLDMQHFEGSNAAEEDEEILYDDDGDAEDQPEETGGDQEQVDIEETVIVHKSDNVDEVHDEHASANERRPEDNDPLTGEAPVQTVADGAVQQEKSNRPDESSNYVGGGVGENDLVLFEGNSTKNEEDRQRGNQLFSERDNVGSVLSPKAAEADPADANEYNRDEFITTQDQSAIGSQLATDNQNSTTEDIETKDEPEAQQLQQELASSQKKQSDEENASKNVQINAITKAPIVKLFYLGEEMFLFPPDNEEAGTFFLSDVNLASESLNKLLEACREILTGSLEHDDELVLDVPALGLHICEDSKYATQISMLQVVEVFLSLNHNENVDHTEPLYCTLSTRVSLASQYAYLAAAAREGKTFSEIAADYVDTPLEDFEPQTDLFVPGTESHVDADDLHGTTQIDDESNEKPRSQSEAEMTAVLDNVSRDNDGPQLRESSPSPGSHVKTSSTDSHEIQASKDSSETDLHQELIAMNEADTTGGNSKSSDVETNNSTTARETDQVEVQVEESHPTTGDEESYLEDEEPSHFEEQYYHDSNQEDEEDGLSNNHEIDDGEDLFADPNETHEDVDGYQDQADNKAHLPQNTEADLDSTEADVNGKDDHNKTEVLPDPAEATPPLTPTLAKPVKRKAIEEEDEFHLLDSGTPEPKRRRPS